MQAALQMPAALAQQPGFARVFVPGRVTLGLVAPFKGYPDSPLPDASDMCELAQLADELGFAALWVRDVPFFDPAFGDVGQGLDALVGLWQHYRGRCSALAGSPARWIWDYRQAYGVDRSPEALLWALPVAAVNAPPSEMESSFVYPALPTVSDDPSYIMWR